MRTRITKLLAIIIMLMSVSAMAQPAKTPKAETPKAETPKDAPAKADAYGICMGIATRCGLLPKGICYMQSGCFNPYMGDRCGGTARQCTGFMTKNSCYMQRGCTWVKR